MLTLELRWFVPGVVSDHQLRSFAGDRRVERRVDQYLLGTGDALGIKRRGAAALIEQKRRLAQTPVSVAREGEPLAGVVERWHKSWPDDDHLAGERTWASVEKRRALRRIGRCRAELTLLQLEAQSSSHVTLAVEAEVDELDALLRSAAALLRSQPELAAMFDHAESCGYPAWLERGARWGSNPQSAG